MCTALLIAGSLACFTAAHSGEKEDPAVPAATDPLPHTPYASKQDLEKNYQSLESTPFDDPSLAYRVVVPISWSGANIETAAKESRRHLIPIGLYTPPENAKTRIGAELGYLRMDLDINVRDWLSWYADVNGMTPAHFRSYPKATTPSWDMLAEHTKDGVELSTRLSAFQWGPHIFLAACTCPTDQYEQYKLDFARICDSFELKKQPEQTLVSKLASVTAQVGRQRYVMRYPDVWTAAAVKSPTEAVTAWQINLMQSVIEPPKEGAPASQEVLAILFVKLVDRTAFKDLTPQAAVESALKELRDVGYEPGEEQSTEKAELKALAATAELHYLPAHKDKQDGEAIIAVATQDASMLVVTSLRPVLSRNPYAWMVGKRALEIMLNYSSVQDSAPER